MSSIHPPYLIHDDFQPAHLRYGFFTRHGGVSSGFYDSLNGGLGLMMITAVSQNRQRAAAAGFPRSICVFTRYIPHAPLWSPTLIRTVEADALVTKTTGLGLILTADCVPVVFAVPQWHYWRGTCRMARGGYWHLIGNG